MTWQRGAFFRPTDRMGVARYFRPTQETPRSPVTIGETMNTEPFTADTHPIHSHAGTFRAFWRNLGGGPLTMAALLHAVILAIGLIWVIRVVRQPEAPIGFLQGREGDGRGASHLVTTTRRPAITPSNHIKQVVAEGSLSTYTLPNPGGDFGEASPLTSLTGGTSGGLSGSTGLGNKNGNQSGNGWLGNGNHIGANPFGMIDPTADALVGTFYDLKQSPKRQPTQVSNEATKEIIREFVTRGWNEAQLHAKYFQAPKTLYQTKIYIPVMKADAAPKAFQCENEVQPSRWIVIYRGNVSPPRTGRYRFVGAGDDVLVVRFDGKLVFDHGYTSGTTGIDIYRNLPFFSGQTENKDLEKRVRNTLVKPPVTFYQYPTTMRWNSEIGGLGVGREFEARAGSSYPIEILISEIPGGLFGASLLIEETGTNYDKSPSGAPILPVFRTSPALPEPTTEDNAPPYDPHGPIWKLVKSTGFLDH